MNKTLGQADQAYAKLEVGGKTELMVMISKSGSVNRMGGMDDEHNPFCMGFAEEGLLGTLLSQIPEEIVELAGRYTFPEPKGNPCLLTLAFEGPDLNTGFEFNYGDESDGPPEEIVSILELMLDLTDEWYDEQRAKKKKN